MPKSRRASVKETRDMLAEIDRLSKENADCAAQLKAVKERLTMIEESHDKALAEIERLKRMLKKLINNADPAIDLDA